MVGSGLPRLAANRLVSKDYSGNRPVNTLPIESTGTIKRANSECDRDPLFIIQASIDEVVNPRERCVNHLVD